MIIYLAGTMIIDEKFLDDKNRLISYYDILKKNKGGRGKGFDLVWRRKMRRLNHIPQTKIGMKIK